MLRKGKTAEDAGRGTHSSGSTKEILKTGAAEKPEKKEGDNVGVLSNCPERENIIDQVRVSLVTARN